MKQLLDAVPAAFSNGEDKDTDKKEMPQHDDGLFGPQRHSFKRQTDRTLDEFNVLGVSIPSQLLVYNVKHIRCILMC